MLLDSILKLHDKIMNTKLGPNRQKQITELEQARLAMPPLHTSAPVMSTSQAAELQAEAGL
jgi:NADH-quinone oxidoreductase subunit B